jgi:predicted PurR-regulated permease PerM
MANRKNITSPPWQPGTRLVAAVFLLILIGAFLYSVRQLATPVVLAWFLAYLLHPLVDGMVRKTRMPRWLAVVLLFLLILALMTGATTGIGFAIGQQLTGVIEDLANLSQELPAKLEALTYESIEIGPWAIDLSQINLLPFADQLSSALQPLLVGTGSILATFASGAASALGIALLVFVIGFYLLLDFSKLKEVCLSLIPESHEKDIRNLFEQTGKVWQAFLRGQLILGVVVGSIVAIILSILGVRFALGLGLIAGLLEFVPIFGPVISGIIAGLVALFQPSNWLGFSPFGFALLILGVFVIVQQVENNILVPRIIGHSLNLNPLIVLLAALAGGILANVLGILLAAPTVATLRLWLGYFYRKIVGIGTAPEPILGPPQARELPRFLQRFRDWVRSRLLDRKVDQQT